MKFLQVDRSAKRKSNGFGRGRNCKGVAGDDTDPIERIWKPVRLASKVPGTVSHT